MPELVVKGEVINVHNLSIDNAMVSWERDRALLNLVKETLGRDVRITKIEESKGKKTRTILVLETQ
jgi:hypothetical protein